MDPISHNVRYFRKLRGMTQAELAKAAGTTQYTVSEIELAHREPHPATLRKLAKALGVRVADFYGESEAPKASAPPSQDPLFNGEERRAFIERCERYVEARVAHYENRLAEAKRGRTFLARSKARSNGAEELRNEAVGRLQDDAFEEFSHFVALTNGELRERWLEDPEVSKDVKGELGRNLTDAQRPFLEVVGRIGTLAAELADSQDERGELQRKHDEIRERGEHQIQARGSA